MSAAVETRTDLQELAEFVVARALLAGASDAEVTIREGDEFSTTVRLGEVETLKESGSRGIGLRVLTEAENGYRVASTSSSDFTPEGIEHLVNGAVALAHVTSVDAFAGLADAAEFGKLGGDLELYHEDVYSLPIEERIAWARRAEAAAMAADTRLVNSDGASFDAATGRRVFANSRGFMGEYRSSYCSVATSPIAQGANGEMQRDYWWSQARAFRDLDHPEAVGAGGGAGGHYGCSMPGEWLHSRPRWCLRRRWRGDWWERSSTRRLAMRFIAVRRFLRGSWVKRLRRLQ